MTGRVLLTAAAVVAAGLVAPAQVRSDEALLEALKAALPFPPATADGTPERGGGDAVWLSRWAADHPEVEVVANPLNDENRKRALEAEQAIQQVAMRAQRRSQADYEKALSDFQRTGRTSEIREISLRDDGLAGEQYDADSQLTITAEPVGEPRSIDVTSGEPPVAVPGESGSPRLFRVKANVYAEEGPGGIERYSAEQAWVFIGPLETRLTPHAGEPLTTVEVWPEVGGPGGFLVWIRGNAGLVQQVLDAADWSAIEAMVRP